MKETAFIHLLCLLIPLIIFKVLFSIFILQKKYKESFSNEIYNAIYKACLMFFLLFISLYNYNNLKNSIFSNPSILIIVIFACVYLCLPKTSSPKFDDLNFILNFISNPLSMFNCIPKLSERIDELFERIKIKENVFLEVFASLLLFISLLFSMFIILPAFYMVS
jgi:hypothetical protein